jgi:xanthine phosphoribosyltransferase|tara:strand:- start:1124 stop:1594 length:471 start_codon:yes stop_codon:yes gene_type:complete
VTKKHFYSWQDIEDMCSNIVKQMYSDNYKPDYIVGLTRGGNIPATIISNMLDIPCEAMKVSFRNDDRVDKNHWLSKHILDKNILIVDDINDTGATFKWIWEDWVLTEKDHSVRFASLTENLASYFGHVKYHVHEVNKAEEDVWLVYPWENVGEYNA